jgi:hypothetical protein
MSNNSAVLCNLILTFGMRGGLVGRIVIWNLVLYNAALL